MCRAQEISRLRNGQHSTDSRLLDASPNSRAPAQVASPAPGAATRPSCSSCCCRSIAALMAAAFSLDGRAEEMSRSYVENRMPHSQPAAARAYSDGAVGARPKLCHDEVAWSVATVDKGSPSHLEAGSIAECRQRPWHFLSCHAQGTGGRKRRRK